MLTCFLHWLYYHSLILKLVPGCVSKLSVGRIQTVHKDFLPLQVFGRSWQGRQLCVQTCLLQLIALLDLKSPSSSFSNPYFVYCWIVCIIFIVSASADTETCPWVCYQIVCGPYPNCAYGFAYPTVLCKFIARVSVFLFHLSTSIYWFSLRQFLNVFKFEFVQASACPRGTNSHWVNTSQFFFEWSKSLQKNSFFFSCLSFDNFSAFKRRVGPRGENSYWVYPLNVLCLILRMLVTFSCLWGVVFKSRPNFKK